MRTNINDIAILLAVIVVGIYLLFGALELEIPVVVRNDDAEEVRRYYEGEMSLLNNKLSKCELEDKTALNNLTLFLSVVLFMLCGCFGIVIYVQHLEINRVKERYVDLMKRKMVKRRRKR